MRHTIIFCDSSNSLFVIREKACKYKSLPQHKLALVCLGIFLDQLRASMILRRLYRREPDTLEARR